MQERDLIGYVSILAPYRLSAFDSRLCMVPVLKFYVGGNHVHLVFFFLFL